MVCLDVIFSYRDNEDASSFWGSILHENGKFYKKQDFNL